MRQKNGKIWIAANGSHQWYPINDIDAKSFRPIGAVWWRDEDGLTIYLDKYEWASKRVGERLPYDVIILADGLFYGQKEHKLYYHYDETLIDVPVVGTKVHITGYVWFDTPDSLCYDNPDESNYGYVAYDEKVCYGSFWWGIRSFWVVGTRK